MFWSRYYRFPYVDINNNNNIKHNEKYEFMSE